jgi:hypothetical protein
MTVENRIASRDCVSQETKLLSTVVYGIFFSQDLADPRDATGLQFGGTSGLLSSDAGLERVRARIYPTRHQQPKVPDVGS